MPGPVLHICSIKKTSGDVESEHSSTLVSPQKKPPEPEIQRHRYAQPSHSTHAWAQLHKFAACAK